jgi:multimeric flavodoxin WrbA
MNYHFVTYSSSSIKENTMSQKVAIVYHSGFGHTRIQAESVHDGAASTGAATALISVDDIEDNWEQLDEADAIIFGSPTYMGSVSAPFKSFMDASSGAWFERRWQNKLAAGFTNSASQSGDKLNTLIQMSIFAAQHGMLWVSLGLLPGNNSSTGSPEDINRLGSYLGAMAQSDADVGPEIAPPDSDRKTAYHLGQRVAELSAAWQPAQPTSPVQKHATA